MAMTLRAAIVAILAAAFALTTPATAQTITTLGGGFRDPWGVAVDSAGNVYVADWGNNAVKRIAAVGGAITTLGSGFNRPYGVAVDSARNVYVADAWNSAVKRIAAADGTITTLGSGFRFPTNVALDRAGNVYVADPGSNAVKKLSFPPVTPVPTLSGWAMIVLGLLLAGLALIQFRRVRRTPA